MAGFSGNSLLSEFRSSWDILALHCDCVCMDSTYTFNYYGNLLVFFRLFKPNKTFLSSICIKEVVVA